MSIRSEYSDIEVPEVAIHRLMFMRFQQYGDRLALTDAATEKSYTYAELLDAVRRLSSALVKLGVKKGDVVSMFSYNTAEWILMFWSLISAGAIVTTVNPAYTKYELSNHLKDSGASYIYTIQDLLPITKEVIKEVPKIKKIISLRTDDPACVHFEKLIQDNGSKWSTLQHMEFNAKEDVAIIPYSSGTTGLPKGVLLTHYNIVANAMQKGHPDMVDPGRVAEIQAGQPVNTIVAVPLYHAFGLVGLNIFGLGGGAHLVLLPKFEPHAFLGAIEKYKITTLPLVPPLVIFLAKSPLVNQYDLSSVQEAACGAAPLSEDIEMAFKERLKVPQMGQGFGMTETTVVACRYGYKMPKRPGSSGKLLPLMEAKIVDPSTGRVMGPKERGELWLRGPQIMKGYLNRPEETKKTVDDAKWLHTGDIGYYDEDHYIYIVDRMKELIKVKGLQVAPAELEALLLEHPKVRDVGVVGMPDERAGELPCAFVVRKDLVTEKELYDYTAERTAPFKHLKGGIQFVAEIPRLPSGKIIRRKLKEMASKSKL